jgi:hypothetical protein
MNGLSFRIVEAFLASEQRSAGVVRSKGRKFDHRLDVKVIAEWIKALKAWAASDFGREMIFTTWTRSSKWTSSMSRMIR